ncbi:S-layer homology domain-containing protein [Veillonella sp. oral taxon 780]|uniref:S-layer homology domain-containing protein n=1 Tax=Veillonella sp. oral taxon 780 TaxID=671229 RepID=UPI00056F7B64|nr:S-layer homology domain-containing protein [Veillonella sp. oral taxon 780]
MMKKHLAVLAATAVLGVTSAFAANPFSDVTPQDWAYQAVAQLASQGIVNGYPDGTFKGQQNITRYEMAQMVAKALVRQDRVDAEQNAIINRLANEFSAELNNLGVRVSTLENKVGSFKFTGDARLKYEGKNDARDSKFDYRGRVQFEGTVNDNTKAVVRLAAEKEFGAEGAPKAELDRVYVQHNFGKYATVTAGRQDLVVGNGLVYDDAFEGAVATVGKDKLNASVAYGYLQGGRAEGLERKDNAQVTVYQLNTMPTEKLTVKGFYADVHEKGVNSVYGASVDAKLGSKVWVGGEYAKQETTGAAGEAWTAGVGYGEADMAKVGTWGAKVQYFDLKKEAPVVANTWNVPKDKDYKGYLATVDYTVAKNVGLSAYATFDSKTQAKKDNNLPEYYRAELNYKF